MVENHNKKSLEKRIAVANHRKAADVVIKNGVVVDVFNQAFVHEDVAITDGKIVGIGQYEGETIIDADGQYVCPGFIDGHVHIESSMVKPSEYSKVVLPHGVTSVITDPHEIANVAGVDGIRYMLDDAKMSLLDVYFMLPSSVPATSFEENGVELTSKELTPLYDFEEVIGLAEVMDYPSVYHASDDMLQKLLTARNIKTNIDGHAAGFDVDGLNVYRTAGIQTDHECNTGEEALERVKRGMHVLVREGSASKDLLSIIPVINEKNLDRFLFCTDDKELGELIQQGSINYNIQLSTQLGMDPIKAIKMATINAAQCYGLQQKGAIAPGYDADILFLKDLEADHITEVYKSGELVAKEGEYVGEDQTSTPPYAGLCDSINVPDVYDEDLNIYIGSSKEATIMEVTPGSLVTKRLEEEVEDHKGLFSPSISSDQLKIAMIERHKGTKNIGLGIVKGLQLRQGAIASTVAHDSHNIVVVGTNDRDMMKAVGHLKDMQGGLAVAKDGEVSSSVPLSIAGLMSDEQSDLVIKQLDELQEDLKDVCFGSFNCFLTLSFLTLPVIPEIKLTTNGLFDVEHQTYIPVCKPI